jgi:hypothetical protein
MASRQYGVQLPQAAPGGQIIISETTATFGCGGLFVY